MAISTIDLVSQKIPTVASNDIPYIDRRQLGHALRSTIIPFTGATADAVVNIPFIQPDVIKVFGNLLSSTLIKTVDTPTYVESVSGAANGDATAAVDSEGTGVDVTVPVEDCANAVRGFIEISWTGQGSL